MKQYTIGALFTPELNVVLLILKNKPDWQKGRYNLPGGAIEDGETPAICVAREFKEECGLDILESRWNYIGQILNDGNYSVDLLTAIIYDTEIDFMQSMTDEKCEWFAVEKLPKNVISNLHWLIPFAKNTLKQGNADNLKFGKFDYSY